MLRPSRPQSLVASTRRAWRRSLQVRVVTITLVATSALVATFGLFLSSRITDGLVQAKENTAIAIVNRDSQSAALTLNTSVSDPSDTAAAANVEAVVSQLESSNGVDHVYMIGGDPRTRQITPATGVPIPVELVDAARQDGFVDQRVELTVDGQTPTLYLVVGRELTQKWGKVELFYLFPLDQEVALASDFGNIITATGVALVIMLALVAYLVTRMVVSPVRVAARTAQRLSNGLLDQRMEVNGEDDLAALAASFNQMAENLQRHILRLEDMSRLQRRFTSDVSHELRTPLTTVRMAADLIFNERDQFDPPVARSAELLQAELDRFEGLLAELLEISRFDAGFAALDAEATNLCPLIARVVARLAPLAERANVDVEVDAPAEPIVAEVDVRRVERILRNLIGNAIEHSEGKPVKVRLAAREGAVAVTVRDHGVGLKQGDEKLVFNRFWRADPSRARHTGGTGLGLSISSEDARLHGGWLEAWGAPGQGAQFRLTLPARAGDRLLSSPLRLVPTDFRPPVDALPEPDASDPNPPLDIISTSPPTSAADGLRDDSMATSLRRRAKAIAGRRPVRDTTRAASAVDGGPDD
jgi:two-component system, OmpR family, sensor histidine kinase MtrB